MSFFCALAWKCAVLEGDSKNNLLILLAGHTVCQCDIGDTGAFYFENIGAEDVKLFLLKPSAEQTYKSFLFLSETMDIFCRAGSVQQAHQSTPSG